ncbi:MAG: sensor domain-containing diguanylate cyclase [bacterium]
MQGLFAGAIAAIFYLYLGVKAGVLDLNAFTFPHGIYKLPFFFLLVGGIIGEIRSLYKKKFMALEKKFHEKVDDLQDLGLQYAALSESKLELDKRIAFQSTTMLNLFESLNNMEKLDPKSLYSKIPELLKTQLNVQCSSIYLVKNNKLKCQNRQGKKEKNKLPNTVDLTYGMMGEVMKTKKIVTIKQMYTEADLAKYNELGLIMSAPIVRKDESIVGVINIEKMPFFDFNANTVRIFEMLSYWISLVVDKAIQFQQLKDKNIADEITGAYNYPYFQKRLAYEIARARRFHTPLSLLLIEIEKFNEMKNTETKNVLIVLNWLFSHLLREIDIIAKYANEGTFAVILPGQNSADAEVIISRLMTEINNFELKPFEDNDEILSLKIGLSSLQISEGSYESLIASAEERLQHGGVRKEADIYADLQYLLNG